MAAAYASLVSLSHILRQILHPHPTHYFITLPRELIQSMHNEVSCLINFLEQHSSSHELEDHPEVKRIVYAAHEAEDIIESDVVNLIDGEKMSSAETHQGLMKVTDEFVSIGTVLAGIENEKRRGTKDVASSFRSLASGSDAMVGFDEDLNQIRDALASNAKDLQIVPIVGMGGAGKTTIATNVFKDRCIIEMFDIRAWVSVSQGFRVRDIILGLLQQINRFTEVEGKGDELGVLLHKQLFGRKYLIVLDDMWDMKAWDTLKLYLPNNRVGSRILVTTRLLNLAEKITSCKPYEMSLLNEEHSWELIHEKVFGKEPCPVEFEEIGRRISRRCGGLPLGLVVIGGLLAKSEKTKEFWEYVEENVSSAANSENDEHCLKILRLSYGELPVRLKPCFLYIAAFPKTFEIRTSRLIRLWVAEGFIKPSGSKSLEEVGEGYFKDLMDRNLIMVGKRGHTGKVKSCIVHDLIRDLCEREAHKIKLLYIAKFDNPCCRYESPYWRGWAARRIQVAWRYRKKIKCQAGSLVETERRLSIHMCTVQEEMLLISAALRSFLNYTSKRRVPLRLDLLRVLDTVDAYSMDEIVCLINSRYITCGGILWNEFEIPSSISLLWNLQTIVLPSPVSLPTEFWQMPQLRHLKMPEITLPDFNMENEDITVLEHLQTLSTVKNYIFKKHILKRIPNLKKLGIDCDSGHFCLSNLVTLDKLESLVLAFRGSWEIMDFPISLRKLTLSHCEIPWEDMCMVGSLPNLEALKLKTRAAKGRIWNPNVGEFLRLKFLLISTCDLEIWEADDSHFPCLEHLQLTRMMMDEIPIDFAEIPSLQIIELSLCSRSLSASAKRLSNERKNLGNEDLEVRSFHSQIQIFKVLDEPIIDAIRKKLEIRTYIRGSNIMSIGSLVDEIVYITQGSVVSRRDDGISLSLSEGDVCGEELFIWCLEHSSRNTGLRLSSSRQVTCSTNVEAFVLQRVDLEEVISLFARFFRSPRIMGAIRYESPYWRGLAARRIQVAWRYRKKRINRPDSSTSPGIPSMRPLST